MKWVVGKRRRRRRSGRRRRPNMSLSAAVSMFVHECAVGGRSVGSSSSIGSDLGSLFLQTVTNDFFLCVCVWVSARVLLSPAPDRVHVSSSCSCCSQIFILLLFQVANSLEEENFFFLFEETKRPHRRNDIVILSKKKKKKKKKKKEEEMVEALEAIFDGFFNIQWEMAIESPCEIRYIQ